ncbi:MAG TPA: hypothetical protein VGL08_01795 [Paraburkholderia sp.]
MKDAFERRALLLHLGAVLDAVGKLLSVGGNRKTTVRQLVAANHSLMGLPLLRQVSAQMTPHEFAQRTSAAFAAWPAELLEAELNRERLAATVHNHLFAADDDGWRAYVASMRPEVPWFGEGLAATRAGRAVSASHHRDEVTQVRTQARQSETPEAPETDGLYPSWPWKPET